MILTTIYDINDDTNSHAIIVAESYVGHVPFIFCLDCGQISPNNGHTNYHYVHNSVLLFTNEGFTKGIT